MNVKFSLRAFFLLIAAIGVFLWFLQPPMRIDAVVARRIEPGMEFGDVEKLIGGPPGLYDGVTEFQSSDSRLTKARQYRSWVGWGGEIRVYGNDGYATRAGFYSGQITGWSPLKLFGQRLMRMQYSGYSLNTRIALALAAMGVLTTCFATLRIPVKRKNATARQGLCGLLVGAFVGVLFFSFGWFEDLVETAWMLVSPIAGAFAGIAIGFIRWRLAGCPEAEDDTDGMRWGEHPETPDVAKVKLAPIEREAF